MKYKYLGVVIVAERTSASQWPEVAFQVWELSGWLPNKASVQFRQEWRLYSEFDMAGNQETVVTMYHSLRLVGPFQLLLFSGTSTHAMMPISSPSHHLIITN